MKRATTGRKKTITVALALGLLFVVVLLAQARPWTIDGEDPQPVVVSGPASGVSSSPTGQFILGDYGNPLLRATDPAPAPAQPIDVDATIRSLTAAHVNTYAYLICPDSDADPRVSQSQWDQLPDFARRAGAAGIDVFVYLVPPTEAPERVYEPFHWDYVEWFDEIGRVASREESVKGIIMDDFGANLTPRPSLGFNFTVPYVEQMTAAARRHVPDLSFLPILYHHDMVGPYAVLSDYRHLVEGVVFPYFGFSDGRQIRGNTVDPSKALAQGIEASDLLNCSGQETCQQIVFPARSAYDRVKDRAVWSSSVVPLPNQRRVVAFDVNDDGGPLAPNSYRIHVVVDGTIVSTVNRGAGWNERVFDITAATANTSGAIVEIQIVRTTGVFRNRTTLQLGDIRVSGMTADSGFSHAVEPSPGVATSPISPLPLIFMPYARPLTAEQGRGASPAYFESVLRQMDILRGQGRIAGSLVFKVTLAEPVMVTPREHYEIMARTYEQWLPR